jgi:uncharacterized membrane protein YqjE
MAIGVEEDLYRLGIAGRKTVSHIATLTQAHVDLLEIELKNQIRVLTMALASIVFAVIAGSVSLVFVSLAVVDALSARFGLNNSLALVAVGNIFLMLGFVILARKFFHRLNPLRFEAVQSLKETVLSIFQRV